MPKYPDIEVQLSGRDDNAFAILGAVTRALTSSKVPQKEMDEFWEEATSGDYHQVLRTAMEWVTVL